MTIQLQNKPAQIDAFDLPNLCKISKNIDARVLESFSTVGAGTNCGDIEYKNLATDERGNHREFLPAELRVDKHKSEVLAIESRGTEGDNCKYNQEQLSRLW